MTRAAAAIVVLLALAAPAGASARTLYVRAGGTGAGTRTAPFGDLGAVERAAAPGARIVVLPAAAVLQGGIRLKPRQRLIGRPGARLDNPAGDVVTLAGRTTVRGLTIVGAGRGGIYGHNVGRVTIRGNDVSHHNTSCAKGFLIPPFSVPTTVPGVGAPISAGLQNGWAGIMVDADRGTSRAVIRGNRVHDSGCGDGIDVRASGAAKVVAKIARNQVAELRQGASLQSVLAIGLQARETSHLVAIVDRNRESGLGNDGDTAYGADSEGVFINPADHGRLRATVSRNTYAHTLGRGGFSANGLEFVSMGEGSASSVIVRDSTFSGTPGDVLEQLALGTGGTLNLTLQRVTATGSTGFAGSGEGNTVLIPGNNGDCLVSASGGARNRVNLTMRDSALTNCANNGLTFGSSVSNGSGPTAALHLDIAGSRLTGNRGNNLRIGNVTDLDTLTVKVQDSDLADAHGTGSATPANASFENLGSTTKSVIDLGGGPLGSRGGNCLDGGMTGAALIRYDVSARHNWWGGPVRASTVGGTLDAEPTLATAPERCS